MTCETCGEKPKKCGNCNKDFPRAVIEINNPESLILLRKVSIPASMGTEEDIPAAIGKYRNVILKYESNGHIYLYSSDGIPTLLEVKIPDEIWERIEDLEEGLADLEQEVEDLKNSPDVVDIVDTYADLQTYDTSALGDKDVIRVLKDETHGGDSSYYRWDKPNNQWTYIGSITMETTTTLYVHTSDIMNPQTDVHLYKNSLMTLDVSAQDILDANDKGQVVLRVMNTSSSPRPSSYMDLTLQMVFAGSGYTGFDFTGDRLVFDFSADSLSTKSFDFSRYEIQPQLTFDETPTTGSGNPVRSRGIKSYVDNATIVARVLTEEDYNWPTDNPDGVAIWLLPVGVYRGNVKKYASSTVSYAYDNTLMIKLTDYDAGLNRPSIIITTGSEYGGYGIWRRPSVFNVKTDGSMVNSLSSAQDGMVLVRKDVYDGIPSSITDTEYTYKPLSAKQAAVLNNRIVENKGVPKTLTTDDYNWNSTTQDLTTPYNAIALWRLNPGLYIVPSTLAPDVRVYNTKTATEGVFLIGDNEGNKRIYAFDNGYQYADKNYHLVCPATIVKPSDGTLVESFAIASRGTVDAVMSDYIISGSGAPTTSTVGTVGLLYENTTNGKTYQCTAVSGSTYTWAEISSSGLVTLSYGYSTWNDFLTAYNAGKIVYCRASSNADPSSGSQTRMAFMAYINNPTTPTEVEFQYVRSVSSKTAAQQMDQVFVYKLTSVGGGTWTVATRDMTSKIVAGDGVASSYNSGTLTLSTTTSGSGAPTTATTGTIGSIYIDTSAEEAYMCVKKSGSTYTWKQITN